MGIDGSAMRAARKLGTQVADAFARGGSEQACRLIRAVPCEEHIVVEVVENYSVRGFQLGAFKSVVFFAQRSLAEQAWPSSNMAAIKAFASTGWGLLCISEALFGLLSRYDEYVFAVERLCAVQLDLVVSRQGQTADTWWSYLRRWPLRELVDTWLSAPSMGDARGDIEAALKRMKEAEPKDVAWAITRLIRADERYAAADEKRLFAAVAREIAGMSQDEFNAVRAAILDRGWGVVDRICSTPAGASLFTAETD